MNENKSRVQTDSVKKKKHAVGATIDPLFTVAGVIAIAFTVGVMVAVALTL